jgi:hypothetical protein
VAPRRVDRRPDSWCPSMRNSSELNDAGVRAAAVGAMPGDLTKEGGGERGHGERGGDCEYKDGEERTRACEGGGGECQP